MERESTLREGSALGPYRVVRRVGRGTFSEVYEALKQPLNRRVALKVLRADHATLPEAIARFEREARLAASVDHPHLVKVLESGVVDGVRVHEMEFLDGPTLSAVMRGGGGPMSGGAACDLMVPLVSAVAALHDRGYVHRDLKPGNVILAERRRGQADPVLIDLGIVKAPEGPSDPSFTRTAALLGSPGYMSPEQARESRSIDARSDQFSLAVVLWELLTGQRLFEGEVLYQVLQRVAEAPITPPALLRPELPAQLSDAVMRALQRDPARRFDAVREFGAALLPFASPAVRDRFAAELGHVEVPAVRSFAGPEESTLVDLRPRTAPSVITPAPVVPAARTAMPLAPTAMDTSTLPPGAVSQETLSPGNVAVRTGAHPLPLSRGAAVGVGVVFVAVAIALFGGTPDAPQPAVPPTPVETFSVDLRVIPESATISLDGREVGVGHLRWDLPRDGRPHRVRARAPGFVPREVEFTDAPPPRELVLVPSAPMGRGAIPTPAPLPLALPPSAAQPVVPQVLRVLPDDAATPPTPR